MASAWPFPLPGFVHTYPEILLALASFLFLFFFHRLHSRSRLPVDWPLIGMIPTLFANAGHLHDWHTDVLLENGCTFVFTAPWTSAMDLLVTCDPANVNHVFNTNFANYPKGDDFGDIFEILGDGIFNADGDSWRFQRKKAHELFVNPVFRSFMAEASAHKVERGLIPLLSHLAEHEEVVDLQDVFQRITLDISCMLFLGVDPGSLSISMPLVPFAKALDDIEGVLFYRHVVPRMWWKILKWLSIWKEKDMVLAWKTIDHFIAECITKRREAKNLKLIDYKSNNIDLLSCYLDSEADAGKNGTEFNRFLRDTSLNLIVAGRDTTSAALSWFFWLVAKNPRVEAKIIEELRLHRPTFGNETDLRKLVYLHAALCETLRLFPPVPFEHKGALQPDILPSGIKVHQRRRMLFSLYAMARMEAIWGKDCMEFKPERWISESGKIKHEPSYKFLSFNAGPRVCLGKDFAFTQMKLIAASIISSFHVEVSQGLVARPKLSVILHMKDGLKVRIRRRDC